MSDQDEMVIPGIKEHMGPKKVILYAILIFLAIFFIYLILNLWAISYITPVIDIDEVFSIISDSNLDFSGNEIIIEGKLKVKNPTFVPAMLIKLYYEVFYGETNIANAKTSYFSIAPYSEKELPVKVIISNSGALEAGGNLIWDSILGDVKNKSILVYADLNVKKFKIETIKK